MARVDCPFCGEWIDVWVDPGGPDSQEYIEDCSVCCRPIRFVASRASDGEYDPMGEPDDFVVAAFRE